DRQPAESVEPCSSTTHVMSPRVRGTIAGAPLQDIDGDVGNSPTLSSAIAASVVVRSHPRSGTPSYQAAPPPLPDPAGTGSPKVIQNPLLSRTMNSRMP